MKYFEDKAMRKRLFLFLIFINYTQIFLLGEIINFSELTGIDDREKERLQEQVGNDYNAFLEKALFVSRIDPQDSLIKNRIKTIMHDLDKDLLKKKSRLEEAEYVLQYLHKNLFKKYNFYATSLNDIFTTGEYNCVSSAILYNIFMMKYQFLVSGIRTTDHAFSVVTIAGKQYDVETTTKYGFNPGAKKDLFNEFGEKTGFSYVPPKNYALRKSIDNNELVALIYNNLSSFATTRNQYVNAFQYMYRYYLIKKTEDSLADLIDSFSNYINSLTKNSQYEKAISTINIFSQAINHNDRIIELKKLIFLEYCYTHLAKNDYLKAQEILKRIIPDYPDEKRFTDAYNQSSLLWIEQDINQNGLEDAWQKIENLDPSVSQNSDGKKIRTIYYMKYTENLVLEKNYAKTISLLLKVRHEESDIQNDIDKLLLQNYNKWALNYIDEKKYAEAVELLNKSREYFPDDNVILNNMRFAFLKWADIIYREQGNEQERLSKTIMVLRQALENLGNDNKILTNIEYYTNDTAAKALKNNDLKKALAILNQGLELHPRSNILKKNLAIIKSKLP